MESFFREWQQGHPTDPPPPSDDENINDENNG